MNGMQCAPLRRLDVGIEDVEDNDGLFWKGELTMYARNKGGLAPAAGNVCPRILRCLRHNLPPTNPPNRPTVLRTLNPPHTTNNEFPPSPQSWASLSSPNSPTSPSPSTSSTSQTRRPRSRCRMHPSAPSKMPLRRTKWRRCTTI